MRTPVYVAVALGLIAFGVLGMLSIGAPSFLTGVAMLAVLPWRRRRSRPGRDGDDMHERPRGRLLGGPSIGLH